MTVILDWHMPRYHICRLLHDRRTRVRAYPVSLYFTIMMHENYLFRDSVLWRLMGVWRRLEIVSSRDAFDQFAETILGGYRFASMFEFDLHLLFLGRQDVREYSCAIITTFLLSYSGHRYCKSGVSDLGFYLRNTFALCLSAFPRPLFPAINICLDERLGQCHNYLSNCRPRSLSYYHPSLIAKYDCFLYCDFMMYLCEDKMPIPSKSCLLYLMLLASAPECSSSNDYQRS